MLFNRVYKKRLGGSYEFYKKYYKDGDSQSQETLLDQQNKQFIKFLSHAISHSKFY